MIIFLLHLIRKGVADTLSKFGIIPTSMHTELELINVKTDHKRCESIHFSRCLPKLHYSMRITNDHQRFFIQRLFNHIWQIFNIFRRIQIFLTVHKQVTVSLLSEQSRLEMEVIHFGRNEKFQRQSYN